jgi:hypothetical protein
MTLPDIDDVNSLGGILQDETDITDPLTQISADFDNKKRANVAMMTHTSIRAMRSFVAGSPPTDPLTLLVHDAQWGNDAAVKPSLTRNGVGDYTVTWPTDVDDELNESHTLNFRRAFAAVDGATAYITTATVTSANVVQVRIFDAAGAAADPASPVTVYVV